MIGLLLKVYVKVVWRKPTNTILGQAFPRSFLIRDYII